MKREPLTEDPVVRAVINQGLELLDAFVFDRSAARATRRTRTTRGAPERATGAWEVAAHEDAVVLLESDGVYSWRYGTEVAPAARATARRGNVAIPATRTIEFDLGSGGTGSTAGHARARRARGPLAGTIVGRVRGWVFKFVARFAAEKVVAAMERKQRVGLVWMKGGDPLKWRPINALRDVPLPTDRTPQILLFVHGTFSSTLGSFGPLGPTVWGRQFLATAAERYDAIIGFDHRTLADDPLQNAVQLLDRLEDSSLTALDVDAIAYSRGGLVLRSLIEYLLPSVRQRVKVRRAVFVAATNNGTVLADPKNWKQLIDLSTNLVAAGARALAFFAPPATLAVGIANHAIGSIGAFVKAMATVALEKNHVPGIAAMMPTGPFVTEINRAQPGQPMAAESMYYAVTSDFDVRGVKEGSAEIPPGLVKWLADVLVDAEMKGAANDLVVNNDSTITIDPNAGVFIKDHKHFDTNPNIYHTVFFTRKEVTDSLRQWLGFDQAIATAGRSALAAGRG